MKEGFFPCLNKDFFFIISCYVFIKVESQLNKFILILTILISTNSIADTLWDKVTVDMPVKMLSKLYKIKPFSEPVVPHYSDFVGEPTTKFGAIFQTKFIAVSDQIKEVELFHEYTSKADYHLIQKTLDYFYSEYGNTWDTSFNKGYYNFYRWRLEGSQIEIMLKIHEDRVSSRPRGISIRYVAPSSIKR